MPQIKQPGPRVPAVQTANGESPKPPSYEQQLAASVLALSQELSGRSLPRVAELTDSLNAIAKSAETGNPGAKEVLRRLFDALERSQNATSKIEIVRG